ncbi:MAG: ABC transporter permease [Christensenellales bacterium]
MKTGMKTIMIICLVLGLALLGVNISVAANSGHIAEIREQMAQRDKLIAQAEMARVLGREPVDVGELAEIEISSMDHALMTLQNYEKAFLVLGIDLIIGGLAILAFHLYRTKYRTGKERKISSSNNILGILLALVMLCLNLAIASNVFLTASNLLNVLQQVSINFVIAIGMTFVIISGGIDLSVGSNIALTGLLLAIMMKNWVLSVPAAIALALVFSALIGLINGGLIAFLNLPPFIATLGMMSIARGAAYTVTGGAPIYTMPAAFTGISGRVANIPLYAILIMAAVFALGWYILRYTRVGRFTYAIGGNENCARLSGININSVKCFVYVVSGLCCGVAAILLTSRLDSALPTNADGQEMDAIAAVVIGGTSMKGGEGSMIGTLIGIMIIGVIANGLNLLGVAQGPQKMVKGLIIVIAVIIDVLRRRAAESSK